MKQRLQAGQIFVDALMSFRGSVILALASLGCAELQTTVEDDAIGGQSTVTFSLDGRPPPIEAPFDAESVSVSAAPAWGPAPASGIIPSVKRTAAGLPEALQDYASWPLRHPEIPPVQTGSSFHRPHRIAYAIAPHGKPARAPHAEGTVLLVEEKLPEGDFICQINTLTKTAASWQATAYARSSAVTAFHAIDVEKCTGCHAR